MIDRRRRYAQDVTIAAGVIALAALVRVPAVGISSLSFADSWVALIVRLDRVTEVAAVGLSAPGFTLIEKGWFELVGFTPTTAQIPALVAGVLAPGLLYVVSRQVTSAVLPSVAAALLLALSPSHATHSVMLKQYALEALLAVLLLGAAWRVIDADDQAGPGPLAVLVGLAILATATSAQVVPVAGAAVLAACFTTWRQNRRRAVAGLGAFTAFAAGWVVVVLRHSISPELNAYWDGSYVTGPGDAPRVVRAFGEGLGIEWAPAAMLLFLLVLGGVAWCSRREPALGILLAGPLLVALALAIAQRAPIGTGRGDIYLYPVVALAGAWVLARVATRPWQHALVVVPVVALLLPLPDVVYPEDPARPLVEELVAVRLPTDQVVANYGTLYSVAVYGPWTDGLTEGLPTVRGFMPHFSDRGIIGVWRMPEREEFETFVAAQIDADRVWTIVNPRTQDWTDDAIADVLTARGYRLESTSRNRSATLALWTRGDAEVS